MRTRKYLKTIITTVLMLVLPAILFVLLAFYANSIPRLRTKPIPTNSKPKTLSIVQYGRVNANDVEVSLINSDGYGFRLNAGSVYDGDPQSYSLPKLTAGEYTINLTANINYTFVISVNIVIDDIPASQLKKEGLLIYFTDTQFGIQIIIGKQEFHYVFDSSSSSYVVDNRPTYRFKYSEGYGPTHSYWRENKWELIYAGFFLYMRSTNSGMKKHIGIIVLSILGVLILAVSLIVISKSAHKDVKLPVNSKANSLLLALYGNTTAREVTWRPEN